MKYRYLIVDEEGGIYFTNNEATAQEVRKWNPNLVVDLERGMVLGDTLEAPVADCSTTYDLWAVDPAYTIENYYDPGTDS